MKTQQFEKCVDQVSARGHVELPPGTRALVGTILLLLTLHLVILVLAVPLRSLSINLANSMHFVSALPWGPGQPNTSALTSPSKGTLPYPTWQATLASRDAPSKQLFFWNPALQQLWLDLSVNLDKTNPTHKYPHSTHSPNTTAGCMQLTKRIPWDT